jgi:hypothetical protein
LKAIGFSQIDSLDINETMLEEARHADPAGTYSLISSAQVPAVTGTYDCALASFVTVEMSNPEPGKASPPDK